jgi:hypothetical protein
LRGDWIWKERELRGRRHEETHARTHTHTRTDLFGSSHKPEKKEHCKIWNSSNPCELICKCINAFCKNCGSKLIWNGENKLHESGAQCARAATQALHSMCAESRRAKKTTVLCRMRRGNRGEQTRRPLFCTKCAEGFTEMCEGLVQSRTN